jgi:hypothetical protein
VSASEQELQLGDLLFTWLKFAKIGPHARLVGHDAGITGIGFGLSGVRGVQGTG